MIESFVRSLFNRPEAYRHQRNPKLDEAIARIRAEAAADRQKAEDAWNATGCAGDSDSDRRFASMMDGE